MLIRAAAVPFLQVSVLQGCDRERLNGVFRQVALPNQRRD